MQYIVISDPVLWTHIMRSKAVDKYRFIQVYMEPVGPQFHVITIFVESQARMATGQHQNSWA